MSFILKINNFSIQRQKNYRMENWDYSYKEDVYCKLSTIYKNMRFEYTLTKRGQVFARFRGNYHDNECTIFDLDEVTDQVISDKFKCNGYGTIMVPDPEYIYKKFERPEYVASYIDIGDKYQINTILRFSDSIPLYTYNRPNAKCILITSGAGLMYSKIVGSNNDSIRFDFKKPTKFKTKSSMYYRFYKVKFIIEDKSFIRNGEELKFRTIYLNSKYNIDNCIEDLDRLVDLKYLSLREE